MSRYLTNMQLPEISKLSKKYCYHTVGYKIDAYFDIIEEFFDDNNLGGLYQYINGILISRPGDAKILKYIFSEMVPTNAEEKSFIQHVLKLVNAYIRELNFGK